MNYGVSKECRRIPHYKIPVVVAADAAAAAAAAAPGTRRPAWCRRASRSSRTCSPGPISDASFCLQQNCSSSSSSLVLMVVAWRWWRWRTNASCCCSSLVFSRLCRQSFLGIQLCPGKKLFFGGNPAP